MKKLILSALAMTLLGCAQADQNYTVELFGIQSNGTRFFPYSKIDSVTAKSDSAAYAKAALILYSHKKTAQLGADNAVIHLKEFVVRNTAGENIEDFLDPGIKTKIIQKAESIAK